jgi:hypothetical protein
MQGSSVLLQPLVNMALNMQLQAWQQASAAAHPLSMAVVEQMHISMAPQQVRSGATY